MAEAWSSDDYSRLPDAELIGSWLVRDDPEHAFDFAQDARIAYVQQLAPLMLKGERAGAYIAILPVQGAHRHFWSYLAARWATGAKLEPPDFLIYIDAAAWAAFDSKRRGPSGFPIQREALIFHELCHLRHRHTSDGSPCYGEDGRPVLALRRHTYEFFTEEATRYGSQAAAFKLDDLERDIVAARRVDRHAFGRDRRAG